ncbi:MAG TPA: hypothetical protein VMZ74_02430 [Ramlibacter sp.]|nr:hypothetical protein [Ramlibacter sp.]
MARIRIAFALVMSLLVGACDSPTSFADAHDLGIAAHQLESLAHEAGWLAQQLQSRSVSADMAWVHQRAIAEEANKALRALDKPVPPELRGQQEAVAKIAAQLQAEVTRIALAVNRPGELEALRSNFESLAKAAHPIAGHA